MSDFDLMMFVFGLIVLFAMIAIIFDLDLHLLVTKLQRDVSDKDLRRLPVRFKKLNPNAVKPNYAKPGDAGLDLTATSKEWNVEKGLLVMGTGIAVEIPNGYVGLLFPRSSIVKTPLMLKNSVGVIDSGYRGEIKFMFEPTDRARKNYEVGERIGQLVIIPYPTINMVESENLSITERGEGGYGSTGTGKI